MADLDVKFHEGRFEIVSQVFCCDIHDTWENRKVWFVILRSLCAPNTKTPLFSYQTIADAFQYKARQNINNFVCEYECCDENVFDYLRHNRKVDPLVVDAVAEELRKNVLIRSGELRTRVNQRLQRTDLTSENIRAALEQIPCTVIRQVVLREIAQGSFHPKETHVLAELFAVLERDDGSKTRVHIRLRSSPSDLPLAPRTQEPRQRQEPTEKPDGARDKSPLDHDAEAVVTRAEAGEKSSDVTAEQASQTGKLGRYGKLVNTTGMQAIHEASDGAVIQTQQEDSLHALLTANGPISAIPDPIVQMVTASAM
jgi:hypothetical protein